MIENKLGVDVINFLNRRGDITLLNDIADADVEIEGMVCFMICRRNTYCGASLPTIVRIDHRSFPVEYRTYRGDGSKERRLRVCFAAPYRAAHDATSESPASCEFRRITTSNVA
jgi:hypothetical protein